MSRDNRRAEPAGKIAAFRNIFRNLSLMVPSAARVTELLPTVPSLTYAYGWCRAVLGQAAAAEAIHAAGLGAEAAPIRRLMLEHFSYAQWLAQDPEEVTSALQDAGVHGLRRRRAAMAEASIEFEDDPFLETYEPWRPSQAHLLGQQPLMKHLGLDAAKADWLAETRLSHAGVDTALRFSALDGSMETVREQPDDDLAIELWRSTSVGVMALNATLEALDALAPELNLRSPLDAVAKEARRALNMD